MGLSCYQWSKCKKTWSISHHLCLFASCVPVFASLHWVYSTPSKFQHHIFNSVHFQVRKTIHRSLGSRLTFLGMFNDLQRVLNDYYFVTEYEKRWLSEQRKIWINGSWCVETKRDSFIQIVFCPLSLLFSSSVTFHHWIKTRTDKMDRLRLLGNPWLFLRQAQRTSRPIMCFLMRNGL
jgi:hypothetical protein